MQCLSYRFRFTSVCHVLYFHPNESFNCVHLTLGLLSLQSLLLQHRWSGLFFSPLCSAIYALAGLKGIVLPCWNHHVISLNLWFNLCAVYDTSILIMYSEFVKFLCEIYGLCYLNYNHPPCSVGFGDFLSRTDYTAQRPDSELLISIWSH